MLSPNQQEAGNQTNRPDLQQSIIQILQQANEPIPTKILVQTLQQPRSEINHWLYHLKSLDQVDKITNADGSNPRWKISHQRVVPPGQIPQLTLRATPTETKQPYPNNQNLVEAVLTRLRNTKTPMSTIDLAKLLGPNASRSMINPTLYQMQKDGLIIRTEQQGKPAWLLA